MGMIVDLIKSKLIALAGSRPPNYIVGGIENPYLYRWWVIPRNSIFNIYLHCFLRSDDDRALHDHPFLISLSWILRNSYIEHCIEQGGVCIASERKQGTLRLIGPTRAHRVELHNGPCWTLFITGPRVREWGFHCKNGWVKWTDFVDDKDTGKIGKGCN